MSKTQNNFFLLFKAQGPVGTYNFQVKVLPNGLATMNSAATFTFSLNVASISPAVSGTGGLFDINSCHETKTLSFIKVEFYFK